MSVEPVATGNGEAAAPRRVRRPRPLRHWVVIGAAIVLVGLAAAYLLVGAVVYERLARVETQCTGEIADNTPASFRMEGVDTAGYLMPEWDEVTFPARDRRATVAGWFVPGSTETGGPVVILAHGLNDCRRKPEVLTAAGMLHRHGFDVLLIDLRDHGESSPEDGRHAGGSEEYLDVLGAWDWLVAHGHPPEGIGLYGQSLGAATVLIARGKESRVAATWEDSSYGEVGEAIADELTRNGYPTFLAPAGILAARILAGDDLTSPNTLDEIARSGARALYVTHGDADRRISVRFADQIVAAARGAGAQVDPWIIPGARHIEGIALEPAEYERRLVEFFERTLRPG